MLIVGSVKATLLSYLENSKQKKRKISTGEESENEDGSESSSSSVTDKQKKKKKKSKHKKKEKHRRKKDAKNSEVEVVDEENVSKPVDEDAPEKLTEISGRDIMGLKTSIDPDEIPEIPAHKFLSRPNPNENKETADNR
jgi:hypothetical protein